MWQLLLWGSDPNATPLPDKKIIMEDFKKLSGLVGIDSVGWRYDPILSDRDHTVEWHISEFEKWRPVFPVIPKPV